MKQESERSVLKHRALNAMMNPHFITNSLYAIKQMAAGETHNARRIERYVVNFSSLVRVNLENAVNLCVSLEVELDRLDKYVEMEQFRLQHSFSYRTEIEETLEVDMIKNPKYDSSTLSRKCHLAWLVRPKRGWTYLFEDLRA